MPPPNGSDSERLLAEIEAYLRTGEAPPPAPEPPRSVESSSARPPAEAEVVAGRLRHTWRSGAEAVVLLRRRMRGSRMFGGPRLGPGAALHPSRGHASGRITPDPPRWTVLRVVLVVGFLVALLLVPVIWKRSSGGGNPDGTDHASAAPAAPGYTFLQVNRSGTPVRWNPCGTIHYQLDLASAPSWAETDIGDALSAISLATGIQFAYDGPTNQFPDGQVPAGGGTAEPAPVVIAWASAAQSRRLNLAAGSPVIPGSAGSPGVDSLARTYPVMAKDDATGHGLYVTGSVVISAAASGLPDGFRPGGAGVLLLHELGRLVGLGDVSDAAQVMNTDVLATGVTSLGPGDRAGLERLGARSGCLKAVADPSLYLVS